MAGLSILGGYSRRISASGAAVDASRRTISAYDGQRVQIVATLRVNRLRFAGFVDRDRAIDDELTDIAKSALNPEATASVEPGVSTPESGAGLRPH